MVCKYRFITTYFCWQHTTSIICHTDRKLVHVFIICNTGLFIIYFWNCVFISTFWIKCQIFKTNCSIFLIFNLRNCFSIFILKLECKLPFLQSSSFQFLDSFNCYIRRFCLITILESNCIFFCRNHLVIFTDSCQHLMFCLKRSITIICNHGMNHVGLIIVSNSGFSLIHFTHRVNMISRFCVCNLVKCYISVCIIGSCCNHTASFQ